MTYRQLVQLISQPPPIGQIAIHQSDEVFIVCALKKMYQLMHDNVFDAVNGFLGKL